MITFTPKNFLNAIYLRGLNLKWLTDRGFSRETFVPRDFKRMSQIPTNYKKKISKRVLDRLAKILVEEKIVTSVEEIKLCFRNDDFFPLLVDL